MHYPESKAESSEILRLLLPHIARHGSGYQPPSYAIWYEYVTGTNPSLKRALDARIAQGGALSSEETRALDGSHIAERDYSKMDRLQTQLQQTLEGLGALVSNVGSEADHYSASLDGYGQQLEHKAIDVEALRGMINALAQETRRMQQSNTQLSQELDASRREFLEIKTQLATVRNEAMLDPLTGLMNRRGLQQGVDQLCATRPEGLLGCALLIADIDHFKKVNDTHGHLLGDRVLQAVAGVLRSCIKGRDLAARLGGEEFAVLLPDTPQAGAAAVAEQIRQTVARGTIRRTDRNETLGGITISLGVAAYQAGETLEQWTQRADEALYRSKQQGRNRVTIATLPEPAVA
jgi:diguanylate cyclase